MSDTYSAVDRSSDPSGAADCQDHLDAWPAVIAYKTRTYEVMRGAERVLDVGCGPGNDLRAVAGGRSVGVDLSKVMCRRSHDRGGRVAAADAHSLPFADATFDGVRADRVLQHLHDPAAGLREMTRVTKSGGIVVVADPDQETLVITVPGVRRALSDAVKQLRRDVGYRNGRLASELPDLFRGVGLSDVTVDAFAVVVTDPDQAFGLPKWVSVWRDRGGFNDDDESEWRSAMERARREGLVYAVTYMVIAGRRR